MVKKVLRIFAIVILVLLVIVLVGPFLVPIPPLENLTSVDKIKDADSQFIDVNGITVHYKKAGQGQPALILLHGFGASTFSWRGVIQPLAMNRLVVAFDRPAFGLTERLLPGEWQGASPYGTPAQADMLIGLMDKLGIQKAILAGNSAGGTVSVYAALKYPERVSGLVLVDAAIYSGGPTNPLLSLLYQTPQVNHLAPLLVRSISQTGDNTIRLAWHDPSKVTPEVYAGYRKPLQLPNWDVALWEFTKASQPLGLPERLKELKMPVLVVTGDDDRIVPTQSSLRLAQEIPGSQLEVFKACGHVPQEECPDQFLSAVQPFISSIK